MLKFFYLLLSFPIFSRIASSFMCIKIPVFKNAFLRWYVKKFKIDLTHAEKQSIEEYAHFNEFFTRAIDLDKRPIANGRTICCPVDGKISQLGPITDGEIFQAKGKSFSLNALVGDAKLATPFQEGEFITMYLSPSDYHRIHMPVSGRVTHMLSIPGKCFSVNDFCVEHVPGLFSRNERVTCLFETNHGPMAMILVGATIVASIHTIWANQVTPPSAPQIRVTDYYQQNIELQKGEEMGHFQVGSTVILLFPKDTVEWETSLSATSTLLMGQKLADIIA